MRLKLADKWATADNSSRAVLPGDRGWQDLRSCGDDQLIDCFDEVIRALNAWDAQLFGRVINRIHTPGTLRSIIDLIDGEEWSSNEEEARGNVFDALLERAAEDYRSGSGQYFTPRALVETMVECVTPSARDTIADPACGTGGFLVGSYEYVMRHHGHELTPDDIEHLADGGIGGTELVPENARLAQLNLLLHGIGRIDGSELVEVRDALATRPSRRVSLVLSNPPLGGRSKTVWVDGDGQVHQDQADLPPRSDLWTTTQNRSLNFVQHVYALLRIGGRAAVVVPDNVLFQAGAGETVRRNLLQKCDLHTILRLPTGIFYAADVKTNVLFFEKKGPHEL